MESYRSGHNEAVLKTVWAHAHVGSNPTLSATCYGSPRYSGLPYFFVFLFEKRRNTGKIQIRGCKHYVILASVSRMCGALFSFVKNLLLFVVMRSPNHLPLYYTIGGFSHAKAIFLPPVKPEVYFPRLKTLNKQKSTVQAADFLANIQPMW